MKCDFLFQVIRYVTRDDLFDLNTTIIIPLNAYILKMIGKLDSVDVNFSSINPINLLLTLNKTKPEMIHFNRFSEASTPVWFQFHSAIKLLALFIILYLVLHVVLMAFIICERIWRHWRDMLGTWREKAITKAEFHIWNELRDKYQPSRGDKVEVLFPNDFNDKNVPQNIKP
ncbi:Uncharacterized protein BM_BM731 [Brugia malayi]|uniref:Uncharacterized protein n=1 Tax=Brugia malayi TaxID=6279 RepID=A0A4E9FBL2_BRUMA|nr:Uncharacterized protein BM_BM731 [Brugia malayi]VIO94187.1 Uncharacterized protein BM_BM731 [Brugia malayi]